MNRRERRELLKMQRQRDKDTQKEERRSKTKKVIVAGVAAGATYAGIRYRHSLSDFAKKKTSSVVESISKTTNNPKMRQRYEETKNVFEGISKAHSQQRGGISGMLDSVGRNINPKRTNDRIRRNISNANEHLSERIRQGAIPKDVRLRSSELNNIGKGAYSRAQIKNLEDILNDESFSERLKEQSTEFLEIVKHAGRKRDTDLFRSGSGGDKDEISSNLLEIIRRHQVDDDLNIRLNFKDDNDLVETAKDFSRAIQEAKLRTREQSQSFNEFIRRPVSNRSNKSMENNKFAQEYLKDQLTAVEGIISSSGSSDDFVSKAFLDKGYEKLTHKYAKNQIEIRDGKTFITDKIGTKNTVDELYSPSYKSQSSFSKKFQDIARQLGVDESVIKNTAYSSDLFINPETMELINIATTRNIIDEGLDSFQQNLQIPVLGLNPLDYLRDKHKRQQSSVPGAVIYRSGDVSSFTGELFDTAKDMSKKNDKSKGVLAKDYLHIDESIYDGDLFDGILSGDDSVYDNFKASLESNKIADGYQILDTRRGVAKNFADVHSGRVSPDSWEGGPLAKIANINTDRRTVVHDAIDNLTNKNEPTFGQNQPRFIAENIALEDYDMASHNIEDIGKKMQNSKFRLSKNTSEEMKDYFAEAIEHDLQTTITSDMFDTREGMLTVGEMVEAVHSKRLSKRGPGGSDLDALDDVRSRIINSYKKAINDPTDFFGSSHYNFRNEMVDSNWANVTGANKPDVLTGEDRMRNLLEEYANLALNTQHVDVGEKLSDGVIFNKKGVLEELDQLRTKTEVQFFGNKMSRAGTLSAKKEVADEWINRFGEQENFTTLSNLTAKIEPFGRQGISTSYDSYTDTPYMPIKKHRGLLRSANESYTKAQAGQEGYLADVFESVNESVSAITGHQLNPTTASIAPWELADKLNRPLDKFGLGLKDSQKKNPFSIVAGLSMSRVFMPIVAYQTAKSLDDFFLDGAGRKRVAQTRANISLDLASIKDMTGLTQLGKDFETYIPGYEHLEGSPIGMALRAGTFGFLGDNRSRDELEEYYRSGEDPIRKGRWWELGSTTPWIGGRIEYYRPNQYRRTMSDWEYTDTMYGSKREYWSNHWMPNIFNPMAPVKHFITDPYHYENKHEDSRPYAVTGGYSSLNSIPLVGPAVNNMVSSVFKRRRVNPRLAQSHRDYLREENERLAGAYIGVNTPGMLNVTPKGKFSFEPAPLDFNIIDPETGLVDEEAVITNDMRFASETEGIGTGVSASGVSQEGPGANITIKDHTRQVLANYNTYLAGVTSSQRQYSPSNVFDAVNPGTVYSTDTLGRSGDYTSLFKGFTDQLKDMMGMRGFLTGEALNFDTEESRLMLEDSSLFNNMRNRFWDRDLGGYDGVGGDLSEIMRRFIGGQDKRQYYNPIRNEMPNWMPGPEYFLDFKHGDPYSKIKFGEIRLPGESYETLYNVQKDQFGNYSAFDRYRILADVAPYSDQYRLAKREVSLLNQNGLLSEEKQEEYRQIRAQVSSKNKKHNFSERKFGNAEIDRQTVTVDKIIDQNTFLTKEHPNNPIKLAGVGIKADDEENVALMRSILKPGEKIEIGLDADAMNRVRDDMMDTMRAVVYAPKKGLFSAGSHPLRPGQNVNEYLSNQSEEDGGTVSIKDDGSAVATAALHGSGQLTIGKTMEWVAHDLLPNIPFVSIFADKFYPVRSPVDEYERLTYSKAFRSWSNPISDWIYPMLERGASMNPLLATATGAGIGAMFSRGGSNQALFGRIGGYAYGTLAGTRAIFDFAKRMSGDSERWIPKRRREQRNLDEYFDKVKYIKYKGLFEQAKELAKKEEGIDIDEYIRLTEEEGQSNKNLQSYFEDQKKWISIKQKSSNSETVQDFAKHQLSAINESLKDIDNRRPEIPVGSYTALALRYKEEYESTLYGAKDTYDYMKIYRALPKRDKEFFTAFQKASPKERQKILELVPKNQKNIYRQQFGLSTKDEDDVSLEEYFSDYKLPDEEWEGWRPEVSLENMKIKVMQNEAMDLTEANYWDEHVERANMDPSEAISIDRLPNIPISQMINKERLRKSLQGAGLKDVRIGLRTSAADVSYFNTQLNIMNERDSEIEEGVSEYLNS